MTAIRHYQGPVPWGRWVCDNCLWETENLDAAAEHVDRNNTRVHLFAPERNLSEPRNAPAMMEMHPSGVDGVYLNFVSHYVSWDNRKTPLTFFKRRPCRTQ
jgi:hypothetical protein